MLMHTQQYGKDALHLVIPARLKSARANNVRQFFC
jgi:hypothetical protein